VTTININVGSTTPEKRQMILPVSFFGSNLKRSSVPVQPFELYSWSKIKELIVFLDNYLSSYMVLKAEGSLFAFVLLDNDCSNQI
jgi:hypothetical protein